MAKVTENLDIIEKYDHFIKDGAKVGVMSYGSSARSAKAAINQAQEEGIPVDFVRPVTLWPFPVKATVEMAQKVDVIVVPESFF